MLSLKEHLLSHFLSYLESPKDRSVLGPLLFIACINGIVYQISSNSSSINLFADDIALYYRTITSADDYTALHENIDTVSSCLASKHLTLANATLRAYIRQFIFLLCYYSLNSLCTHCFRLNVSLPLSLKMFEYISYYSNYIQCHACNQEFLLEITVI